MPEPATPTPAAGASSAAVSVIIPARNEAGTIAECLHALGQQTVAADDLEVIVVASGDDDTAEVAARAGAPLAHFEVLRLPAGNKNAALRLGCERARGQTLVLLDADTCLEPEAIAALRAALASAPATVATGALRARVRTPVACYLELQHRLVKELDFDHTLTGSLIAAPRAAFPLADLGMLLPDRVGATDDAYLSRQLITRGWRPVYVAAARASTLFAWTVPGLVRAALRNRRGMMAVLPFRSALAQAGYSAVLVAAVPVALAVARWHTVAALLVLAPLVGYAARIAWRVERLRRLSGRDYRSAIPMYLVFDLLTRALKLWAFIERIAGRRPPLTFRGERHDWPAASLQQ